MLRLPFYHLALWIAARIPTRILYGLAELVGDLFWLFAPGVRADVEHNQRRALPADATARDVARSSRLAMRNLCKIYVDEFRTPGLSHQEFFSRIDIVGMEHLHRTMKEGRGAIVTTAHFGAPQIVAQILTVLEYPAVTVVEHTKPEAIFRFMSRLRASRGLRLISSDSAMLPLVRTLQREKGVVALAVDRDVTGSGIWVPFMGEETRMPDGAVRLALLTQAPLLVAHCQRFDDGSFRAWIQPPLDLPKRNKHAMEEQVREGLTALLKRVELFIREKPEQWVVTVPLWRDGRGMRL
jgi:KDO2-lipid IV(A) lauroyltransferase